MYSTLHRRTIATFGKLVVFAFSIGLLAVIVFPQSSNAKALPNKKKQSQVSFSIKEMSAYTVANSPINLKIQTQITNKPLKIEVFSPTSTRSELFNFANDLGSRRVRDSIEIPFSSLIPDSDEPDTYSFQINVNASSAPTISLKGANVFPIAVKQKDEDNKTKVQYSFVTNIPSVGANGSAFSQKLSLVNVLQYSPLIDRLNTVDKNGQLNEKGESTLNELERIKRSIATATSLDIPFSLLINPDAIEAYDFFKALESEDEKAETFYPGQPLESTDYLGNTYVPTNISELEKIGKQTEFGALLSRGKQIIARQNIDIAPNVIFTKSITKSTLDTIAATGVRNIFVEDQTFKSNENPATKPAKISTNSIEFKVASYDTSIESNLPSQLSSGAKANYLVAATSVVALEAPSNIRSFALPINLDKLDESTVRTYLNEIVTSPLVSPTTSSDFFASKETDNTISRRLERGNYGSNTEEKLSSNDIDEIIKFSDASISVYEQDSTESAQANWMRWAVFTDQSLNIEKAINPENAESLALQISDLIELPKERTLTITSRENEIPVTIQKNTEQDLKVVVTISSNRLLFPEGSSFEVELEEENTTITIPIRARTSGSFPISIEVSTPKNEVVVASQNATVRSTVFSGAGIFIAVGSALFLAAWWASHYKKTRKKPVAEVFGLNKESTN